MRTIQKINQRNGWKKLFLILFICFLVASIILVNSPKHQMRSNYNSSQLQKTKTKGEDYERIDYINNDGIITIAADLGYATVITKKISGGIIEAYYDERGLPISRYSGFYALFREYDDNGNNIKITYLDKKGEPFVTQNGYAVERRTFNENKEISSIRYYNNEDKPVLTATYGYGKIYEYDKNGYVIRIVFIDESGCPMMTQQGFSILNRYYYTSGDHEKGKVEREFYFDENNKPVALSLGQYGIYKEYDENGREVLWTYLDENGDPMTTSKGYATVCRTFQADNSVATERYYDIDGKPYSLSEGQYGIKTEDGQTIYLDERGNAKFNLKTLLYNQSWVIFIIAIVTMVVSAIVDKRVNSIFLIIYICGIAYLTLMYRENDKVNDVGLLWSFRNFFLSSKTRASIIRNIWLFIPFGTILFKFCPKRKILVISFALSVFVETTQYFTKIGFCDFMDVICNVFGAFIGFYIAGIFELTIKYIRK